MAAISTTKDLCDQFPASFMKFLTENDIDPQNYSIFQELPRYIRFNPRRPISVSEVEKQLGCSITPISWLPDVYCLPGEAKIAGSIAYKRGSIYGIDAASVAAIVALDPQPGESILDLCCAPGAKLCCIGDKILGNPEANSGFVTGMDIDMKRLAACRTVVQKYGLKNVSLCLGDGQSFDEALIPIKGSNAIGEETIPTTTETTSKKKKKNCPTFSEDFFYQSAIVGNWSWTKKQDPSVSNNESNSVDIPRFDKVIVDAECSHDGSVKHLAKFDFWGWDSFEQRFFNPEKISKLQSLQKQLLQRGFNLVKQQGIVVYSTCSMTKFQNEDVVAWFLEQNPNATLIPIPQSSAMKCRPGSIPNTIRFDPLTSGTGALFVAKFKKEREKH